MNRLLKKGTVTITYIILFLLQLNISIAQVANDSIKVKLLPNENWWGGVVRDGHLMPFDSIYSINLWGNNQGNQIQPLLLSDKGRVIWSHSPIKFTISEEDIIVISYGSNIDVTHSRNFSTLKEAFNYASRTYFPASGKTPDKLFFTQPQYNTWIELIYNQNQDDILRYANNIIKNGFPAGVLMIDDNWQEDYGKWQFHPGRFSDPEMMMDSLHQMGFKVMLWICPFVSPDSDVYRELEKKGYFIKEASGDHNPLIVRWWNGASAVLDFTNPRANQWFKDQLNFLSTKYDVDGFKFDAGDSYFYNTPLKSFKDVTPNEHTLSFQEFGLDYPLNEYRATWKMGGQPLAQRLHDKGHNWNDLQKLIPQMMLQGILGYPFNCPDMIGGGEYGSFINLESVDQELIVRSAQVHALMPMMQFSVAPWRVLDQKHLDAVMKSVEIRNQYVPLIMDLVEKAAQTGEPIVRYMEYEFPGKGYQMIQDQFMLGSDVLVAPVLQPNVSSREVVLPKGKWKWKGKTYSGGRTITVKVDLNDIPIFTK